MRTTATYRPRSIARNHMRASSFFTEDECSSFCLLIRPRVLHRLKSFYEMAQEWSLG